jgi:hypothetical protein
MAVSNPRVGHELPSVRTAFWYNRRVALDSTTSLTADISTYSEQIALSGLNVWTYQDEAALKICRDANPVPLNLHYFLFTEIGYFEVNSDGTFKTAAPFRNGWCMSSIPWRTAIEYTPRAWLHLASTTATATASSGAAIVSVADLSKIQQYGTGGRAIIDVWDSTGATYLGVVHGYSTAADGRSATTGAGTIAIPTSGYGSIGYNPATLSGVGATNPQTSAAWTLPTLTSIPSGAILRCRIRSGIGDGQHTILADPTSTEFRDWTLARYTAFRNSVTTGAAPTNLYDGIFLDNLHTNASKLTSYTPSGVYPTPYVVTSGVGDTAGTAWTSTQWNSAHVQLVGWLTTNLMSTFPNGQLWGNAYPTSWTSSTNRAAYEAVILSYRANGLDGVMLEDWPTTYSNPGVNYLSQANFDLSLTHIDTLSAAGLGIICVGQSADVGTPASTVPWDQSPTNTNASLFITAVNLLVQPSRNDIFTRYTSSGYQSSPARGGYSQWWPVDDYHIRLGRPTGPRTYSSTTKTYSRPYQFGTVSINYSVSPPIANISPTPEFLSPLNFTVPMTVPLVIGDGSEPTFILGYTRPSALNTGVPVGTALTTVIGDITTTANGQIIENKEVFGFIVVKHTNVTIRNCKVRGRDTGDGFVVGSLTLPATPSGSPAADGAYARAIPTISSFSVRSLIYSDTSVPTNGLLVDRCTLIPDYPSWWCYGVYAQDGTTVNRCNIANCGDMISVRNGAATITGNYLHDSILFDNDYDQRSSSPAWWSHNDGVSVFGGSGTLIQGNSMNSKMTGARIGVMAAAGYADLQYGACVTVAPNNSAVKNLTVDKNWMSGGAACFQANALNTDAPYNWVGDDNVVGTITNNRVAHDGHEIPVSSSYQIRYKSAVMFTTSGNVWDSDAATVAYNAANTGVASPGSLLTVGFSGGIRIP